MGQRSKVTVQTWSGESDHTVDPLLGCLGLIKLSFESKKGSEPFGQEVGKVASYFQNTSLSGRHESRAQIKDGREFPPVS